MSAAPRRKFTEEEYLATERGADFRSEYHDGEIFAMAGATYPHNRVKDNLARHIGNQLAGTPCFPLTSDMKVKVTKTRRYLYPDILVICGQPLFPNAETTDVILNPIMVVEVLSPSTELYDRKTKLKHYTKIETLKEVVLLSQYEPLVERYVLHASGDWVWIETSGLESELIFDAIAVRVPLRQIYEGVDLELSDPG